MGRLVSIPNVEEMIVILKSHLIDADRATLAFAALKSLDRNDAASTAQAALVNGAGPPIAPLFNHMDEAAFWADMAESEELEAYCFVAFMTMSPSRQRDFIQFVQGKLVA